MAVLKQLATVASRKETCLLNCCCDVLAKILRALLNFKFDQECMLALNLSLFYIWICYVWLFRYNSVRPDYCYYYHLKKINICKITQNVNLRSG